MRSIKRVCVIGSGVMGSGIAAQIANSRTDVILLDVVDEKSDNPSNIVQSALRKMLASRPAPLSHPDLSSYITPGNLRDDLDLIKDCDLIIEVIIEKLEAKHELYEKLLPYIKEKAIIASNTSTLPLAKLKEKLPSDIQNRFIITHFFNPPRYMELLELVSDENNDKVLLANCKEFISNKLGKTIIPCNDTPGFIANRIGCFLLEMTVREAIARNLNPVFIDQIFTKFLGFPSTGIFALYDLIGHDVMALITKSLTGALRENDKYHEVCRDSRILLELKNKGFLGRKAGSGFYKLTKTQDKTVKQIFDFAKLDYVDIQPLELPETLGELFKRNDAYSSFFKDILITFFSYIDSLMPEISDSPNDVDEAMKLGYSLKYGPFELLKLLKKDIEWPESIKIDGQVNSSAPNKLSWQESAKIILSNDSAELLEYQNHHILIIKTKMNSLNHNVFRLIIDSVKYSEDKNKRLIIHPGKSKHYSVGADLRLFLEMINNKSFKNMEEFIDLGQSAMMALKYSKINVISCAYGLALGGGCELLLHSHKVVAHQNLTAGLVELGVGLIPGWGGVKEMFLRSQGKEEQLIENLQNILMQYQSTSSDFFAKNYKVECNYNMNINNIIAEALDTKDIVRQMISSINLPKIDLASKIDISNFDDIAQNILQFFQNIIDIGQIDEKTLLNMEREQFIKMAKDPECARRINKVLAR